MGAAYNFALYLWSSRAPVYLLIAPHLLENEGQRLDPIKAETIKQRYIVHMDLWKSTILSWPALKTFSPVAPLSF